MNAISMKLESKQLTLTSNKEKPKISFAGKKCKPNKKRSSPANTNKDALQNHYGLGRTSSDPIDANGSNLNSTLESFPSKKARLKKPNTKPDKMPSNSEKMQERLQQVLSADVREKISSILNDIRTLSDVEKLFLYLQLPTGASIDIDPFKPKCQNPLGKKADEEGLIAVNWIQSHFEEDPDVSLPKQEVYNEYQSYCQMTGTDSLCAADFGKVMKQIFPSVKPRRLGQRGSSRYCYSGLRKKLKFDPRESFDIQAETGNTEPFEENLTHESTSAACSILFQWAEKLLGSAFTSLKDLAIHLVENMYVDNRSVAAFTVLLESSPQYLEKEFSGCDGGMKKSDAQIHLQRKIQEKELIKEQRKKLQEERSHLVLSKGKSTKKRGLKSRKPKVQTIAQLNDLSTDNSFPSKSTEASTDESMGQDKIVVDIKEEPGMETLFSMSSDSLKSDNEQSVSPVKRMRSCLSPGSSIQIEDNVKKKSPFILTPSKSPVCVSQTIPNIIIVPSLPHPSDVHKNNPSTPKYKRIQPKPPRNEAFTAVIRSRAGSVGSAVIGSPKSKSSDGRRSSHAWLQSVGSPEKGDDVSKNIKNATNIILSVKSPTLKTSRKSSFIAPKSANVSQKKESISESSIPPSTGADVIPNNLLSTTLSELIARSNLSDTVSLSLPLGTNTTLKRHLDDSQGNGTGKRLHLDYGQNGLENTEAGVSWNKDIYKSADFNLSSVQNASLQLSSNCIEDEVSVHDIEGDALLDYLRGTNTDINLATQSQLIETIESEPLTSSNKVQKLSQLRMLLEQNLPKRTVTATVGAFKKGAAPSSVPNSPLQESVSILNPINPSVLRRKKLPLSETSSFSEINSNKCNMELFTSSLLNDSNSQMNSIEKLFSCGDINSQIGISTSGQSELLSNPGVFLVASKVDSQQTDTTNFNSQLLDIQQNTDSELLMSSNVRPDVEPIPHPLSNSMYSGRVSTYTQVPSVPPSPNTRRRAFNFMPISPRSTPIPDALGISHTSIPSPILTQYPRNMMSVAVGPSQPPSNAGSPYPSPRSTPVSMCRSRHSSGQSTSRHTPFQNVDSGVSSVSSSPFISPQPTPIPVSRLRHNSSHNTGKTVTFCSVNNPQIIHPQSSMNSLGQIRPRHNSGPGAGITHLPGTLCNTRNLPLSPLLSDACPPSNFVFPVVNELRSRHNSGSNTTTPMSPVSEQTSSSSSCTSNLPDLTSVNDSLHSHSFLNDNAGDLLINGNNSHFRQVRPRHASGPVIYNKSYMSLRDTEIQNFFKNGGGDCTPPGSSLVNRSQSVPLHQMLANLDSCFLPDPKSHPSTPVMNQTFTFNMLQEGPGSILGGDKSLVSSNEWGSGGLEGTRDLELGSSARRNLATLLDPPLSDDLQTTLEDLRDCDTDFSKFAQELELCQADEDGLQYQVK